MTDLDWLVIVAVAWALAILFWLWLALPLHAHDQYTSIYNFAGINCCDGRDCAVIPDGSSITPARAGYYLGSEWVPLPMTAISPDNHWHVCRYPMTGDVRCLMVPSHGS